MTPAVPRMHRLSLFLPASHRSLLDRRPRRYFCWQYAWAIFSSELIRPTYPRPHTSMCTVGWFPPGWALGRRGKKDQKRPKNLAAFPTRLVLGFSTVETFAVLDCPWCVGGTGSESLLRLRFMHMRVCSSDRSGNLCVGTTDVQVEVVYFKNGFGAMASRFYATRIVMAT